MSRSSGVKAATQIRMLATKQGPWEPCRGGCSACCPGRPPSRPNVSPCVFHCVSPESDPLRRTIQCLYFSCFLSFKENPSPRKIQTEKQIRFLKRGGGIFFFSPNKGWGDDMERERDGDRDRKRLVFLHLKLRVRSGISRKV